MANQHEEVRSERLLDIHSKLLQGWSRDQIREYGLKTFGVKRPTIGKMIEEAKDILRQDMDAYKKDVIPMLLGRLEFLYKRAVERESNQGDWLALSLIKETAEMLRVKEMDVDAQYELSRQALIEQINKNLEDANYQIRPILVEAVDNEDDIGDE